MHASVTLTALVDVRQNGATRVSCNVDIVVCVPASVAHYRQLYQFESTSEPLSEEVDRTAELSLLSCAARAYLHVGMRLPTAKADHCSCRTTGAVVSPDAQDPGADRDRKMCETCCLRRLNNDVRVELQAPAAACGNLEFMLLLVAVQQKYLPVVLHHACWSTLLQAHVRRHQLELRHVAHPIMVEFVSTFVKDAVRCGKQCDVYQSHAC
jgi:hypothetical protein